MGPLELRNRFVMAPMTRQYSPGNIPNEKVIAYYERRAQCEAAAAHFGVQFLRDVTPAQLERDGHTLDDITRQRAKHVIHENARTCAAAVAMRAGDAAALGRLMNESHESLRNDYEVSSDKLDAMVQLAREQPGCLGARMTGAGFGGCAVALVESAQAETFVAQLTQAYQVLCTLVPKLYVCQAAAGASVVGA